MSNGYRNFLKAAVFEDKQLGIGTNLKIADVAARGGLSLPEAQRHAERMVREGLAQLVPRQPGEMLIQRGTIEFALSTAT
jgi:hypothetical protein